MAAVLSEGHAPPPVAAEEYGELESPDADQFAPREGISAILARWAGQLMVLALIVMMGVEMLVRTVFGWSIQVSNELGGYALVAITFLTLASGQFHHAYHRVHFLEHRLSERGKAMLRLVFDLASTVVTLVLLLEMIRFEWITWQSGDVSATVLLTPLWIPRLSMPIGCAVLAWAMLRTVAGDVKRLRAAGRGGSHAR